MALLREERRTVVILITERNLHLVEQASRPQGRNFKFSIRWHATCEKIVDKALKGHPIRELVVDVFARTKIFFQQNVVQDLPLKIGYIAASRTLIDAVR